MVSEEGMDGDSQWTILKLIQWTAQHFRKAGIETPRLDAEILLAHVLGTDRLHLYTQFDRVVGPQERARFRELVKRRAQRVPCKWLTGTTEFYGIALEITEGVFVPRPETELIVQSCLQLAQPADGPWRILELCAGCGAIAIAVAVELSNARVIAVELDEKAAELAQRNVKKHSLEGRLTILRGDLFAPLGESDCAEGFDFILVNPPYVPSDLAGELDPEVALHEPRLAWDGGVDGLDCCRRIFAQARGLLRPGGNLIIEIGEGQAEEAARIAAAAGLKLAEVRRDAAKIERTLIFRCDA